VHRSKRGLQPEFGKIDAKQRASALGQSHVNASVHQNGIFKRRDTYFHCEKNNQEMK
jgi:hypothetical protein